MGFIYRVEIGGINCSKLAIGEPVFPYPVCKYSSFPGPICHSQLQLQETQKNKDFVFFLKGDYSFAKEIIFMYFVGPLILFLFSFIYKKVNLKKLCYDNVEYLLKMAVVLTRKCMYHRQGWLIHLIYISQESSIFARGRHHAWVCGTRIIGWVTSVYAWETRVRVCVCVCFVNDIACKKMFGRSCCWCSCFAFILRDIWGLSVE